LAVGCWLLAVGCWLLAVGCWLLKIVKICETAKYLAILLSTIVIFNCELMTQK
jgi:hypothetical protein